MREKYWKPVVGPVSSHLSGFEGTLLKSFVHSKTNLPVLFSRVLKVDVEGIYVQRLIYIYRGIGDLCAEVDI